MQNDLQALQEMYLDNERCALAVGLKYVSDTDPGLTRKKAGKGFTYTDHKGSTVSAAMREQIENLVIPPAWQDVWICGDLKGHILVTGKDEKGRKQYIYNPKWRTARDLMNFYRTLLFAEDLPHIRSVIDQQLKTPDFKRDQVIAAMLWILDNSYIRIGNDIYFAENESIGLTTMTDSSVTINGDEMVFEFMGKSSKDQHIELKHPVVAKIVAECKAVRGPRLFQYKDEKGVELINAQDLNAYLSDITTHSIHAKDFRTWGGTLAAFDHLIKLHRNPNDETKPEKAVLEAVDKAAEALGNTRAVAREHYVHPHILETYATKNFDKYYKAAQNQSTKKGLTKRETELLYFLEQLFKEEFELLKN